MVLGTIAPHRGRRARAGSSRWFARGFVDGAEWAMAPNAAGMALFADGGEMMSKPYAAGGNYIDKMSGHCAGCQYSPREEVGAKACPVTAPYWTSSTGTPALAGNRRTRFAVSTWERMDGELQGAVKRRAGDARKELGL